MTATMLRGIFYTRFITPEYSGILFFSPLLNARILIFQSGIYFCLEFSPRLAFEE